MTWAYAERDATRTKQVRVDGYLVGYARGVNSEDGLVRVLVTEPRQDRKPAPMRMGPDFVDAVVRAPVTVNEVWPGLSLPPLWPDRGDAYVYATLRGWVDAESRPVAVPFEIVPG